MMARGMLQSFLIILIFLATVAGCSKHPPFDEMEPGDMYRYLVKQYEKEKYLDVTQGFDFFTLNYSGHGLVDSAQYLLGQAHFHLKEYILAADAFEDLTRRFPNSSLVADAMYMVGECYWKLSPKYALDQHYTIQSIDAFQNFIDYYPYHAEKVKRAEDLIFQCRDKLAHKQYANGIIYLKMKDYRAANIYFSGVIEQYYDSEWAPKAAFKLGESLMGQKRFAEAEETFQNFLVKYPDHPWADKTRAELSSMREREKAQPEKVSN